MIKIYYVKLSKHKQTENEGEGKLRLRVLNQFDLEFPKHLSLGPTP